MLGAAVVVVGVGVGIAQSGVVHDQIETMAVELLSDTLGREVRVGQVKGNLLTEIRFEDVEVAAGPTFESGVLLKIGELEATCALTGLADFRDRKLPRFDDVVARDFQFDVVRNIDGSWAVFKLLDELKLTNTSASDTVDLGAVLDRFRIENMTGAYIDHKGWGKQALQLPFVEVYRNVTAEARFIQGSPMIDVEVVGDFEHIAKQVRLTGQLDAQKKSFDLVLTSPDMEMDSWGNYTYDRIGYGFSGGRVDFGGRFWTKTVDNGATVPFHYRFRVAVRGTEMTLPFFPAPAADTSAVIVLRDGAVGFESFRGVVQDMVWQGHGEIDFLRNSIDLQLASDRFALPNVVGVIPALSGWTLTGQGDSDVRISGRLDAPEILGTLHAPTLGLYGFEGDAIRLGYRLADDQLTLSIRSGTLYEGSLSGGVKLDLRSKIPVLNLAVDASAVSLNRVLSMLSGTANLQLQMTGPVTAYDLRLRGYGTQSRLYQQKMPTVEMVGTVRDYRDVTIDHAYMWLNDAQAPIQLSGQIDQFVTANVVVQAMDYPLVSGDGRRGVLQLAGRLQAILTPTFWRRPLSELSGLVDLSVTDWQDPTIGRLSLVTQFDPGMGRFQIAHAAVSSDVGTVQFSGQLDPDGDVDVVGDATALDVANGIGAIVSIPDYMAPVGGVLTGPFHVKRLADNWTASGTLSISQAMVRGQGVDRVDAQVRVRGKTAYLDSFRIQAPRSMLMGSGWLNDEMFQVWFADGTRVMLDDFRPVLSAYGQFTGEMDLDGGIGGAWVDPNIALHVDGRNVRLNQFTVARVFGGVSRQGAVWQLDDIRIQDSQLDYAVSGHVDMANVASYDVTVVCHDVWLGRLLTHLQTAGLTGKRVIEQVDTSGAFRLENDALVYPRLVVSNPYFDGTTGFLYRLGSERTSLVHFAALQQTVAARERQVEWFNLAIAGRLKGRVRVHAQASGWPQIAGQFRINDVSVGGFQSDQLFARFSSKGSDTMIELISDNGVMGQWDYFQVISQLTLSADGRLDIDSVKASQDDGTRYDRLLSGSLPLGAYIRQEDAPLSLSLHLSGPPIGLIAGFFPAIQLVRNDGHIVLDLAGRLSDIRVAAGEIVFDNAILDLQGQPPIYISKSRFVMTDNRLQIPNFSMQWEEKKPGVLLGLDTRENKVDISGEVTITGIDVLAKDSVFVSTDLRAANTRLAVNLPGVFEGELRLENVGLVGSYEVAMSGARRQELAALKGTIWEAGPTLSAQAEIRQARLLLSGEGAAYAHPSIRLDLGVKIGRNVTVEGGLLGDSILADLANRLRVELDRTDENLIVTGALNAPRIQNSVRIQDGEGYLVNRIFEVMRPDEQRRFLSNRLSDVSDNTVRFDTRPIGTSDKLSLVPIFDLKAVTVIEPVGVTINEGLADLSDTTEGLQAMMMIIDGPIDDLTSINFEQYDLDRRQIRSANPVFRQRYQLQAARSADSGDGSQDVQTVSFLQALMPELVVTQESLASGESNSATVVNELSANRLNLFFKSQIFRPIEKELESQIGLYDVQVDYNAGRAVLEGVGAQEAELESQVLGVNFVENVADNLFLRVRTDIDLSNRQDVDNFRLSEIELTYFLMKNLSLNYANIQEADDTAAGYRPRLSMKYSYEF